MPDGAFRYKAGGFGRGAVRNSRAVGSFGVAVILSVIVGDQLRTNLPGQPIEISFVPHILAILGVAFAWSKRHLVHLSKDLRSVVALTVLLCIYGTVIGVANGLPTRQIIAGWITYAGLLPGLLLGFAIGGSVATCRDFGRWIEWAVLFCILVAISQQFGLFSVSAVVLEDAPLQRGIHGLGGLRFSYTSGPFRTASIFSGFLAFTAVIVLISRESLRFRARNDAQWVTVFFVLLTLMGSLLAARRSGLIMLLGCYLPFFFFSAKRTFMKAAIALSVLIFIWFEFASGVESDMSVEIGAKLAHSTTHTGIGQRLSGIFEVRERDIRLLSVFGDGLGSYGPSVRAGGPVAVAKAQYRLDMHPVLHFGWFKDLAAFGATGLILHLLAFYRLCSALRPHRRMKAHIPTSLHWVAFGLCLAAALVYFFIATSWLQSITGGLLFGLAVGFGAGYFSQTKSRSPTIARNKHVQKHLKYRASSFP